jgi:hypothetical protein
MNNLTGTPRNLQHAVRNELGQYAAQITTPANVVNQQQVNENVNHWLWLYAHGFSELVQPNEIFAGTGK